MMVLAGEEYNVVTCHLHTLVRRAPGFRLRFIYSYFSLICSLRMFHFKRGLGAFRWGIYIKISLPSNDLH